MPIILPSARHARADDSLLEFLREKRPSGPLESAICLAAWLTRAAGRPWVSAIEVQALSRQGEVRALLTPIRCASDVMRTARRSGLLLPLEEEGGEAGGRTDGAVDLPAHAARYRVSPLGHAVAAALPDRRLVRSVRHSRRGTRRLRALP